MYGGCGWGWGWMMLMPLLWFVLIGLIVWAVVRLAARSGDRVGGQRWRETPGEILDRRFASGEIDIDTYRRMREQLAGKDAGSP